MHDDFLSRSWADHHGEMSAAIHKAFQVIGESMAVLNRHQFAAPWRHQPTSRPNTGR